MSTQKVYPVYSFQYIQNKLVELSRQKLNSADVTPQQQADWIETDIFSPAYIKNKPTLPATIGDVVGPSSAVTGNIVLFDGTTGKLIKDSGANLSQYQLVLNLTTTGNSGSATLNGGTSTLNIPVYSADGLLPSQTGNSGKYLTTNGTTVSWATISGGMTNPMTTAGDIIYGGTSGTPTRLGIGTNGFVLQVQSGNPSWFNLFGTANTWTALQTFNPSITASGAIARSVYITSTLTASANNDVLVALDINPTFTPGAFTGVTQAYFRTPTTSASTAKGGVYLGGNNAGAGTDLATSPDLWIGSGASSYTYLNFLPSSIATYGQIFYGVNGSYLGMSFIINGTSSTTNVYNHKFWFRHAGRLATIGQEADTIHAYSAPTFNNFYLRMSSNNDNTRYFKIFTDNASAAQTERFGIQGFSNSARAYFNNVAGVGFNVTVPTALVHVGASTTTVASIRIASGTAPTTPNDGDMWYDGSNLIFRNSTTSIQLAGVNISNTFTASQTIQSNTNRVVTLNGINSGGYASGTTITASAANQPVSVTNAQGIIFTHNESVNTNTYFPLITFANRSLGGYVATVPEWQLRMFSPGSGATGCRVIEITIPSSTAFTASQIAERWDIFQTSSSYAFKQYYLRTSFDTSGALNPASALIHIGAAATGYAQMNLKTSAGTAPSAPADGDIWYDGTNLKMRVGSTTKTFTLV